MPPHPPPNIIALLIALNEVSGLLKQFGCATQPIQEVLYNPPICLLVHPSYSVQIASATCLQTYCLDAPGKLSNSLNNVWTYSIRICYIWPFRCSQTSGWTCPCSSKINQFNILVAFTCCI
ncbi:hypothetical protein H4Q26_008299 [Puccinia striiformis f. sp. tritici PST-130]|nr:hypothetical protein H4Q26_008299 [Puccinia striiformis f. sp. tritici PST-130]